MLFFSALPLGKVSGRHSLSPAPLVQWKGVVILSKMSEKGKEAFQRVRENFQRLREFGWFAPSGSWTKEFSAWPERKYPSGLGYRQAAVLFLLSHYRGQLHVLITKRSFHVTTHKGEYINESMDYTCTTQASHFRDFINQNYVYRKSSNYSTKKINNNSELCLVLH